MSESAHQSDTDRQRDAFARLFAQHDRWLYGYLVALLGNASDAEEVFQEVCVVVWREHAKFELGTDFVKWTSVIAHHQVQKFRRQRRRGGYQLSDEAVELIAADAVQRAGLQQSRRDALQSCLEKLSQRDRELVRACYSDSSVNFKTVAQQSGRPANTVYKALRRIRRALYDCIERAVAKEGRV